MRSRFPGPLRLFVVGGALLLIATAGVGGCDRGGAKGRREAPPAAAEGSGPGWELVYDLELDGRTDLFAVAASGGTPRRLTDHAAYDGMARYTPDGTRIVFSSERSGHWQLWDIDAEGGEPRRIRANDAVEYQADPSPDGKELAFLTQLDGPERLVVTDMAGERLRDLVRHGRKTIFGNPSWSADGRLITFSSNWRIGHQIYVVDLASGETRRISPMASGGCEPRFMRDGRVCYVSRGHLRPTSRLVAHHLETGEEEVLVDWPAMSYDPAFSPDGTEIAFASNISGNYAIYRQRLSDGQAWRVTFGPGEARYPDYRPAR
jgi:Tol biopolymer transport system component